MNNNNLSQLLLKWYETYGRDLPWRVRGGAHPNPYVVLVSEIMLQQTTVKTVIPYFYRFMNRFPTVEALADSALEDVYLFWQGLGYYTRARSLHESARIIVKEFSGKFPSEHKDIKKLKGLGSYTRASYLALAFNQPETVIDGNVIRIICRMENLTQPIEEVMEDIKKRAKELTDQDHAADYASAIMDLGAIVCTPKKPQCLLCPWQAYCRSKNLPDVEFIPLRRRISKKETEGYVYIILNQKNEIYIRKRTEKGLLSGLFEFPWSENILYDKAYDTGLKVNHIFTHINLTLKIFTHKVTNIDHEGFFVDKKNLEKYPMSTLMKKVLERYLASIK